MTILENKNNLTNQKKFLKIKKNKHIYKKNNKYIKKDNECYQAEAINNNEKLNNLIENESPAQILSRLGIVELATRLFENTNFVKNIDNSNSKNNINFEQLNVPTNSPTLF